MNTYIVTVRDNYSGARYRLPAPLRLCWAEVVAEDADTAEEAVADWFRELYAVNLYDLGCSCCGAAFTVTVDTVEEYGTEQPDGTKIEID